MSHREQADRALARKALRIELRRRRRALSPAERSRAAERVAREIEARFHLHPGQNVALYNPLPGELDVAPLAATARRHGCTLYVPRITHTRHHRMRFVRLEGPLRVNRLGILEPRSLHAGSTSCSYRWWGSMRAACAWGWVPATTTGHSPICTCGVPGGARA